MTASAAILWALFTLANAHPFGSKLAAHQLKVHISAHELAVDYTADVPNAIVATATRSPTADPLKAMALELHSGLLLLVDGTTVPLEPTEPWTVEDTEDTQRFHWSYRVPLETGVHNLDISNGNLPGVMSVHSVIATVSDGIRVKQTSLWRFHKDKLVRDDNGRWRTTDDARSLSLTTVAPSPLTKLWTSSEPVSLGEARIHADTWFYPLAVAALSGILGLGVTGWRRRRARQTALA